MTSHSSVAFTKPAFAFCDAYDHEKASKTAVSIHSAAEEVETTYDRRQIAEIAHQERHKRRIRIARTIQNSLTSLLSLAVAVLQGKMFITYQTTKHVAGAWPDFVNLLPTLMLFATACAALIVDICALTAYLGPQSRIGRNAFSLAVSAHYTIKMFKGVAYSFSTIVCRSSYVQGNASGMNNDLWSWSCSSKADAMANVNQAAANCTGSNIAWILAISNIGIEVLGILIDQVVRWDDRKWEKQGALNEMKPAKSSARYDHDTKPLLTNASAAGKGGKGKYQKLSDENYAQLGKVTGDFNVQLKASLPEMQLQQ